MKLKIYPLITTALCLSSTVANAELLIQIQTNESGATPTEVAISDISQIKFETSEFSIIEKSSESQLTFGYNQVQRISFINDDSGIESTPSDIQVAITPNPVRDMLSIKGCSELYGNNINIFSVTGAHIMSVADWNGQSINVSHLPAGIYFINIQTTTLKFIKL